MDENKEIITIHDKVPPCVSETCELYNPDEPALYVIEVKSGFSERHGLGEGDKVEFSID